MTYRADHQFRFGKHAGVNISEVLEKDINYVLWVRDNLNIQFVKSIHEVLDEYIINFKSRNNPNI